MMPYVKMVGLRPKRGLQVVKEFLDKHPEFCFEMTANPESIDRDYTEYILCIRGKEDSNINKYSKACLVCDNFEDLEKDLDALIAATFMTFNITD